MKLSGIISQSITDGVGLRMVVFTQGCPHRCPGCHNPHTHDYDGGMEYKTATIMNKYIKNPLLAGITFSGGEPFVQAKELIPLADAVYSHDGTVWCYTGYTWEELIKKCDDDPSVRSLLERIDVLVDGRYEEAQRDLTLRFRGSRNQRILDVKASMLLCKAVEVKLDETK